MFGKTNSFVASSGSGSGSGSGGGGYDVIYAVNNTGSDITAGTKVWLNQHIWETNSNARISWSDKYSPYPVIFNRENQLFASKTTSFRKLSYSAETNSWSYVQVNTLALDDMAAVYYKDGIVWTYKHNGSSCVIRENDEQVVVAGCVLSGNKVFATSTSKLTTYDAKTGVIDAANGAALPSFNTSGSFLHLDGNLLFYQRNTAGNYLYDVSDYANPVLLASPVYPVNLCYAKYMTGVSAGNYIFADSNNVKEFSLGTFYLFKIVAGYHIEAATDVPESLRKLIGVRCRFSYNNKTHIFIIGTSSQLFFYKFENGEFHEFTLNFGNMPGCINDFAYLARLTDDMTSIGITSKVSSGSYTYYVVNAYRLQVADDTWYAESFAAGSSRSLVGFATGEQNEDGLYEIKTLLPEVCSYNLIVTPTPDVIEFEGEAV